MARWFGAHRALQGPITSAKNARKPAPIMTPPTKKQIQTFQNFFKTERQGCRIFGGFEQLSIAQSAASYGCAKFSKKSGARGT